MKIAISVESTVDLSKELLKQYNLEMIPFTVLLGETAYLDGDITSQDIFDFVAKEKILPRTSAINDFQYREYFDGLRHGKEKNLIILKLQQSLKK